MDYKRIIRFQYYRILCKKINSDGKWGKFETFDFVDWINCIDKNNKVRKSVEFNRTLARVDRVSYKKDYDLWGIRFMKLRDTNIPTKVKENEEAEAIPLEDDEYIGEDVMMVYEKKSSLAMIQSNRFSLGVSKLEELFNHLYAEDKVKIFVQPVAMQFDDAKLRKTNYRNIDISFANLGSWNDDGRNQALGNIISNIKKIGGYSGHVTIGLGYSKYDTLDKNESKNIINEVLSNKKFIRSAKVKVRDDDDTDVEIIDLLEDIYHDFITFVLQSKTSLEYESAIVTMMYYFNKRKNDLYSEICYKP